MAIVAGVACNSAVSVISMTRLAGSSPVSRSVSRTPSTNPGCWTSRAETLTPKNIDDGASPSRSQRPAWAQVSRRTQWPIDTMAPVSSAIWMNRPGAISAERRVVPADQRLDPREPPLARSTIGW